MLEMRFLIFLFLLFPFLSAFGKTYDDNYFIRLAVNSVKFQIPEAKRLVVNGNVLNPQVISGCNVEDVKPLRSISIKRVGSYLVQLKVKCKGSFLTKTLNVNLKVDAEVEGYRTVGTVERGESLRGKVRKERILLSEVRGNIFNGNIDKVVARVKLLPGTVVLRRHVEVPFAVKRGQLVRIVAEKNGIYVETTGRALQNGRVGDIIRVKNIYSKKVIEGKVKDDETVVVDF